MVERITIMFIQMLQTSVSAFMTISNIVLKVGVINIMAMMLSVYEVAKSPVYRLANFNSHVTH